MKCFNCHEDVREPGGILVSMDGDFVCGKKCKEEHERKRDKFLNETIHDDEKMAQWWAGKD